MHQPIPEGEVEIFTSPWVSGTRAASYYGPVMVELVCEADWEENILAIVEQLRERARDLGANAVVGFELTLDPFYGPGSSLKMLATGTAAKLEVLKG